MLDRLGTGLKDALKKLAGKSVIDKAAVDELVRDLQRALLQADVNVKLVMSLSQSIKTRSLEEDVPKGMSVREHVLRIVYEELIRGEDGKLRYFKPLRFKLYRTVVNQIKSRSRDRIPLYFCMESGEIWRKVLKKEPKGKEEIEHSLSLPFGCGR